jgi:hypothetical protein
MSSPSRVLNIPIEAERYTDLDLSAFYVSMPPDLRLHTENRAFRTWCVVEAMEADIITEILVNELRRREHSVVLGRGSDMEVPVVG